MSPHRSRDRVRDTLEELIRKSARKHHAKPACLRVWTCTGCSNDTANKPETCVKCGGSAFENRTITENAGPIEATAREMME